MPDLFQSFACRCESCSDDPGPTYTRKYLELCRIADEIADMPSGRSDAMERWKESRGPAFAEQLAVVVRSAIGRRRNGTAGV